MAEGVRLNNRKAVRERLPWNVGFWALHPQISIPVWARYIQCRHSEPGRSSLSTSGLHILYFLNNKKCYLSPHQSNLSTSRAMKVLPDIKEAVRHLHWQAKMLVWKLSAKYTLPNREIYRILEYPAPEKARLTRTPLEAYRRQGR